MISLANGLHAVCIMMATFAIYFHYKTTKLFYKNKRLKYRIRIMNREAEEVKS